MKYQRFGYGVAAAAAVILAVGACSSPATNTANSPAVSSSVAPSPAVAPHNDVDVEFAQMMVPHHQQAVEMSEMLLGKQGIDPRITSLAVQIKDAQGPEIEQMRSWLAAWGEEAMPGMGNMPGMPGMGDMPGHDMPGMGDMPGMSGMSGMSGMMSAGDMAALENAQGAEAGRLFLTQMIEHHRGAITMAQAEIDGGQYPAAVEMARNIVTSQQAEITTMQGILDHRS